MKIEYYVVWIWKTTGIFNSREKCKEQVNWCSWAKYKSFSNLTDAKKALNEWRERYYDSDSKKSEKFDKKQIYDSIPFFRESIAVDAACSGNPWTRDIAFLESE